MTTPWPQYIWITLILVGMGVSLARYGEPKKDRYDIIDVLIGPTATAALLYWGGWFTPLGW